MIGSVVANQGGRIDRINKVYRAYDYVYHAADWTPQNAVNAALGGTPDEGADTVRRASRPIHFGPGQHNISASTLIYSAINPAITCDPGAVLNIVEDMDVVFDICGTSGFTWRGGTIQIADGVQVGQVFKLHTDQTLAQLLSLDPYVGHVGIQKTGAGVFDTGVQLGNGNTLQGGEALFEHIQIDGSFGNTSYGFHAMGGWANTMNGVWLGCRVYNCNVANRANAFNGAIFINTGDGGEPNSGGGQIAYQIDSRNTLIIGGRFEAFRQYIVSGGPSTNRMSLVVLGAVLFEGQEMSELPVIDWRRPGNFYLQDFTVTAPATVPKFTFTSSSGHTTMLGGAISVESDDKRPAPNNLITSTIVRGLMNYTQALANTTQVSQHTLVLGDMRYEGPGRFIYDVPLIIPSSDGTLWQVIANNDGTIGLQQA